MTARYAVYFAPAKQSPWWTFGAHWLGRDECDDKPLGPVVPPTLLEATELAAITAEPRRYGFHATLKAPFQLAEGGSVDALIQRMQALASTLKPVSLGPLQAVMLDHFVALVPLSPSGELASLAASCVVGLDDLRAPLSAADLRRRRAMHLNAREQELLLQYGYPHVLERFRLHFTLSGPVTQEVAQRVMQEVAQPVAQLNASAPLCLDRLCLFVEAAPGQPFKRIADASLSE